MKRRLVRNSALYFALLITATALMYPPRTLAQQQEMDDLARKLAEVISRAHQKSVLVLDFTDLDGTHPELEAVLADELSSALTRAANGFQVLDRANRKEIVDLMTLPLEPDDLKGFSMLAAKRTGAAVLIIGEMWPALDKIQFSIWCFQARKGKKLATFIQTIPVSPAMRELFDKWRKIARSIPPAGTNGYGLPKCEYCPSPSYTEEASAKKVGGRVLLQVVVTEEGRITNILFLKGLGYGLDQKAIEQVRQWKLRPAIGPDGKPAAVTTMIEVTFRLL